MATITILLPTYNGARFLQEQLRSIVAQTHRDWVVLALDDGSSDATLSILQDYAASDPRVRVVPTSGNQGQRRRLEQALDHVGTDLVAVSDQDDIWAEDKLALLLAALDDRDMCFGASELIDGDGERLGRRITDALPPQPRTGDRVSYLFRAGVSAHAMLARRDVLSRHSLRDVLPFDWAQSLDAAFRNGVAFAPEAVTFHRLHGGNQANGAFTWKPSLRGSLRPGALATHVRGLLWERHELLNRMRYLAASAVVDQRISDAFRRLYETLRIDWFDKRRAFAWNDRRRAEEFWSVVGAMCGDHERDFVRARTETLFQCAVHPRRLLQYRAGALHI